ncbi:sigma-70 family RNA polymerase sigma factor [Planctomycetota bacterium]
MSDVTRILNAIDQGDAKASNDLLPLVYEELRMLAAQRLSDEQPGQTLQATALVHEAYIRLVGDECPSWNGRGHFFGAAAEAMRRILVENARRKRSLKRGGGRRRIDLAKADAVEEGNLSAESILSLDEALDKLSQLDARKAELVKLRFFSGLTNEQAARAMNISANTADRYWAYARAWLRVEMRENES